MTTTTNWSQWLAAALAERDWTQADLIRRSDNRLDAGLVSRWLSAEASPQLPNIRVVCRALGVPAVEGMIAAGRLLPDDVGVTFIRQRTKAADLSARELAEEAARRFQVAEQVERVDGTVVPMASDMGVEGESWAARRRKTDNTDAAGNEPVTPTTP